MVMLIKKYVFQIKKISTVSTAYKNQLFKLNKKKTYIFIISSDLSYHLMTVMDVLSL